jgi:hypothetical protein
MSRRSRALGATLCALLASRAMAQEPIWNGAAGCARSCCGRTATASWYVLDRATGEFLQGKPFVGGRQYVAIAAGSSLFVYGPRQQEVRP